MTANSLVTRMAAVKPRHIGGPVDCTISDCTNLADREPIPGPGRGMGVRHAHYATPMRANVAALAVITIGGYGINVDKDRREGRAR